MKQKFNVQQYMNRPAKSPERLQQEADHHETVLNHPEDIRALVLAILNRGQAITDSYDDWLRVGFALASELGEDGRQYFHQLSEMSSKYDARECDQKYNQCLKQNNGSVSIKTLYFLAQNAGINLQELALAKRHEAPRSAKAPSANKNNNRDGIEHLDSLESLDNLGNLESEDNFADFNLALGALALRGASAENGYTFSDKLDRTEQNFLMRIIIDNNDNNPAKCDAMMLGALNVVSGLLGGTNGTPENRSGIYGIYDGRRVYAPLFNIIYSGAGNEKGDLMFAKMIAHQVKSEMRRRYEAEKQEYDRAMAEWNTKGKKDRGEAPAEPIYRDPFVPGNSSSSAVYRSLDANGGWGLMFETEADTVSTMIDSDYGNYSDLMRKAHHHEPISMNRVTDKVHIDIDEPRLSIFLTCTPGQLPSLFPSFENGLGSRFLFYNIPDDEVAFHDVFALKDNPLEDIYKQLGDRFLPLYHELQARKGHPIQFVMSKAQQQEFVKTYQEMLHEQFAMLGKGIRAFVFRIALECFRYAMILTVLRRLEEWSETFVAASAHDIFSPDENALVCDDRDFHTAMTIIGCLIHHTARIYAVMAKEDSNPFVIENVKLTAEEIALYKALPEGEFKTAQFIATATRMNIPKRSAQRMLNKFCNICRIVTPVTRGTYFKPASTAGKHDGYTPKR